MKNSRFFCGSVKTIGKGNSWEYFNYNISIGLLTRPGFKDGINFIMKIKNVSFSISFSCTPDACAWRLSRLVYDHSCISFQGHNRYLWCHAIVISSTSTSSTHCSTKTSVTGMRALTCIIFSCSLVTGLRPDGPSKTLL